MQTFVYYKGMKYPQENYSRMLAIWLGLLLFQGRLIILIWIIFQGRQVVLDFSVVRLTIFNRSLAPVLLFIGKMFKRFCPFLSWKWHTYIIKSICTSGYPYLPAKSPNFGMVDRSAKVWITAIEQNLSTNLKINTDAIYDNSFSHLRWVILI